MATRAPDGANKYGFQTMETFQTEPETEILTCPKSESSKRQDISQTLQNSIHVEKMEMFNMRYKHFFTLRLYFCLDFSISGT